MSNSTILKIAAVIGVAVSIWMLVTYEDPGPGPGEGRWERTTERRLNHATNRVNREPESRTAWRALGGLLARHDHPDRRTRKWIRESSQEIRSVVPVEAYAWYWLGWGRVDLGLDDDAKEAWRLGRDAFEEHVDLIGPGRVRFYTWFRLGVCHVQTGNNEAAQSTFQTAEDFIRRKQGMVAPETLAQYCESLVSWRYQIEGADGMMDTYELWLELAEAAGSDYRRDWSDQIAALDTWLGDDETRKRARGLIPAMSKVLSQSGDLAAMASLRLRLGDQEGARSDWARAAEDLQTTMQSGRGRFSPNLFYNLACYLSRADEIEMAIDAWSTAVNAGWTDFEYAMEDPDLEAIRDVVAMYLNGERDAASTEREKSPLAPPTH